jgi:hypothetical protein
MTSSTDALECLATVCQLDPRTAEAVQESLSPARAEKLTAAVETLLEARTGESVASSLCLQLLNTLAKVRLVSSSSLAPRRC